jgi:hypothetical protein
MPLIGGAAFSRARSALAARALIARPPSAPVGLYASIQGRVTSES